MMRQTVVSTPADPFAEAVTLTRAALAALRRGDSRAGERLLRAALRYDPGLGVAWLWLGALQQGARRTMCLRWARLTLPDAQLPTLEDLFRLHPAVLARQRRQRMLVAGGALAVLLSIGGMQVAYAGRVYPGVQALGRPLEGQTLEQALADLQSLTLRWAEQPLELQLGNRSWSLPLGRLGHFDAPALAGQAYAVGRSGNLLTQMLERGQVMLDTEAGSVAPVLDDQALERALRDVAKAVERPPRPARFALQGNRWQVLPEQVGLDLDLAGAHRHIAQAWAMHGWDGAPTPLSLQLALREIHPARRAGALLPLLPALQHQTAAPLLVRWEQGQLQLDRAELLDLQKLPRPGQPFAADRVAVEAQVRRLAAALDQPALPSRLVREGAYVRDFRLSQTGWQLDQQATARALVQALEQGLPELKLPLERVQPAPGEAEALGLVAVIGEGRSQFAGYSSPARDQNVLRGGQEFDGLLVPPGAILSANQTISSITEAKGYRWGDMIENGQLVPALGGGICQVTTTLFRAAFWSGLEILERHNHTWRLPWYELDAPAGMDATIVLGGPDLQLRNNTGQHLLIKVETDLQHKTQRFIIYGTPPGWHVEMLGPTWQGGTIVIGRRVTRDGALVLEDYVASTYLK